MKKYNYKEEDNNLFYHVNNKVLVIFYFFSTSSHLYNRVRNIDLLSVICFSLFIFIQGPPVFRRVILKEELQEVLELYHYSDEKGGHSGRDAMIFKIGKTFPKITIDKFQLEKKF